MSNQAMSNAAAKERKAYNQEKKNPLQKVIRLINQFWSIDQMYASSEEKLWAKERLEQQIQGITRHLSKDIHGSIKASLKSKAVWESTREYLA